MVMVFPKGPKRFYELDNKCCFNIVGEFEGRGESYVAEHK